MRVRVPPSAQMFTIYILLSTKNPKTYVGYTANLEERINLHNDGRVSATKYFRPWKVIYTENTNSVSETKNRERYWKSGAGRRNIKNILNGFPPRFKSGRGSRLVFDESKRALK